MTELKITWNYGRGNMQVDADAFLSMRNVAKVRKLLKIIRESDTPEQETVLKDRIEQFLSATVGAKKAYANKAVDWGTRAAEEQQKLEVLQLELNRVTVYRDDYKRNSSPWKDLNERVKEVKSRMKQQKEKVRFAERQKRDYKNNFKTVQRNEEFCKKLLSEVFS
jgi:hypothetical protein